MGPGTTSVEFHDRVNYHRPTDAGIEVIAGNRKVIKIAGDTFILHLPEGREKACALTKLEEALFWANAAVARNMRAEGS